MVQIDYMQMCKGLQFVAFYLSNTIILFTIDCYIDWNDIVHRTSLIVHRTSYLVYVIWNDLLQCLKSTLRWIDAFIRQNTICGRRFVMLQMNRQLKQFMHWKNDQDQKAWSFMIARKKNILKLSVQQIRYNRLPAFNNKANLYCIIEGAIGIHLIL